MVLRYYCSLKRRLEVKTSSIPTAGLGLFTRRRLTSGDVICEYTGRNLRTREAIRQASSARERSFFLAITALMKP